MTVLGEGLEVGLSAETTPPTAAEEEVLSVIIWDCFGMTSSTEGDWAWVSEGLGVGLGVGAVAWRPSGVAA